MTKSADRGKNTMPTANVDLWYDEDEVDDVEIGKNSYDFPYGVGLDGIAVADIDELEVAVYHRDEGKVVDHGTINPGSDPGIYNVGGDLRGLETTIDAPGTYEVGVVAYDGSGSVMDGDKEEVIFDDDDPNWDEAVDGAKKVGKKIKDALSPNHTRRTRTVGEAFKDATDETGDDIDEILGYEL